MSHAIGSAVLGLTLTGAVAAYGADVPTVAAEPGGPTLATQPATPAASATLESSTTPTMTQPPASPQPPPASDQLVNLQIADAVKMTLADAQKQRAEYLSKRAELLKSLRTSDTQGREQIRVQLKEARDRFLTQQREARTELQKNMQELKDRLADHADVIDHAKENAKNTAKSRRDGAE